MHHELWLTSIINGQNNVGNSNYQNAGFMNNFQVPAIPNGYCIRYHQGHYCQLPCRYNHKCFKCNRLHPSYRCWQQQNVLNENANSFNNLRSSSTYKISNTTWKSTFAKAYSQTPNFCPMFSPLSCQHQ